MSGGDKDNRGTAPGARFANLGTRSGSILGRYELVRRIGAGGMAEVYEAIHRGLKKTVAVKVLLPETAANPDLVARFLREGEAASRIQHPHVVDVTDVAEDDGVAYMVMEYLEGQPLSQLLHTSTQGRLSVARALDILLPIAAALDEAHAQGVVHRDLKPENVFIARAPGGKAIPKILDFGVSKLSGRGIPSTTAVSSVLGTPHYMSPEQARGESEVDGRADQYSFALMIYECITGVLPFRSDNVVALIHEVIRGVGTPPSAFVPDLPPELDEILLKALRALPEDRYLSIAALCERLLPFASERGRDAFMALLEKEPRSGPNSLLPPPPAAEITGTFQPTKGTPPGGSEQVPTAPPPRVSPTVAQRKSARRTPDQGPTQPPPTPDVASVPPAPSAEMPVVSQAEVSPPRRGVAIAVVLLVLLAIGGGVAMVMRGGETEVPTVAPVAVAPIPVAPPTPAEPPTAPGAELPAVAEAPARMHVAIVTEPSTATLELDGEPAGTGTLAEWVTIDGTTHRLVVRAPGHAERAIEFVDEPPPMRIVLDRVGARPGGRPATRPTGHEGETPEPETPRPDDEDIRSTR